MLHFFSLKNPESEETKQCQRAVRLFRLLNLFCCYFFLLLRRTEHCLLHFNIETSSLFIGEQFPSCIFFLVDYRIYHSDCISTVKLIVRFFRDMYIFYLKIYNKTCKLDYTLFVPHNQYMYFQGLWELVLKKNKKQKKKNKMEKIPSIFGVNINLAVRSEYANAFLIGPNLHSLFVLRRVVKSTLQIGLIYWCSIINFAIVRKTRKPNNSY